MSELAVEWSAFSPHGSESVDLEVSTFNASPHPSIWQKPSQSARAHEYVFCIIHSLFSFKPYNKCLRNPINPFRASSFKLP